MLAGLGLAHKAMVNSGGDPKKILEARQAFFPPSLFNHQLQDAAIFLLLPPPQLLARSNERE